MDRDIPSKHRMQRVEAVIHEVGHILPRGTDNTKLSDYDDQIVRKIKTRLLDYVDKIGLRCVVLLLLSSLVLFLLLFCLVVLVILV